MKALFAKKTFELRPVYHRLEERIRDHVLLCWLALLLVRVAKYEAKDSWSKIKQQLGQVHLGKFENAQGFVCQRTELTNKQISYFKALKVKQPPRFLRH